jgi:hypothetical protein
MCARIAFVWICLLSGWINAFGQIEFIENKCQWPDAVKYKARIPGGEMQLQSAGFSYTFLDYERLQHLHDLGHGTPNESHGTNTDKLQSMAIGWMLHSKVLINMQLHHR